jgi:hypothetical protein
MHKRRAVVLALLVAGLLAGCDRGAEPASGQASQSTADPTPAKVPQTTAQGGTTAAAVVADLKAHGFKVGRVTEDTDTAFSGARESVSTRINGVESGVLVFPDVEAAHSWAETSESFGGIAVVGDTWAVSLDSDGSGGTTKAQSRALAAKIAEAVGGTVGRGTKGHRPALGHLGPVRVAAGLGSV